MKNIWLASKSPSRQYLLREAQLPFMVVEQNADESRCDWSQSLEAVVGSIARYKMEGALLPAGVEGQVAYVLTADTLTQDMAGVIHGKPVDYADAQAKFEALQPFSRVATAFCLQKKQYSGGEWRLVEERNCCVVSVCEFMVPENWRKRYVERSAIGLEAAGGMAVEAYGMQFLKSIQGSYSAVIGLPLYELREALETLGFFDGGS